MIIAAGQSATPYPSVDLLVDAIPTGTWTITVYRSYDGQRSVVRNANKALTNGASIRPYVDVEPPFSTPITYSAYATSKAGAQLGVASAVAVTVVSTDAWISDPLAPARACKVVPINESMTSVEHITPGSIDPVLDSPLSIASMGTTQAGNFELLFMCETADISARTRDVLQHANPFLLRIPPEWNYDLPSLAYLAHTSYSTEKVWRERDYLALTVTAVQPPPSPVALSDRTYGDVRDEASTYGAIPLVGTDGLYPDYLGVLRGH